MVENDTTVCGCYFIYLALKEFSIKISFVGLTAWENIIPYNQQQQTVLIIYNVVPVDELLRVFKNICGKFQIFRTKLNFIFKYELFQYKRQEIQKYST